LIHLDVVASRAEAGAQTLVRESVLVPRYGRDLLEALTFGAGERPPGLMGGAIYEEYLSTARSAFRYGDFQEIKVFCRQAQGSLPRIVNAIRFLRGSVGKLFDCVWGSEHLSIDDILDSDVLNGQLKTVVADFQAILNSLTSGNVH
jgi:hypothetical protein